MRKFFPDFDRPIVAPDTTSRRPAYFRGRGYPIGPGYKPHVSTPPGLREFPSGPEHPPEWADPGAPYARHPNAPKPFRRTGKPSVPVVRPGVPRPNLPRLSPLRGFPFTPWDLLEQPLADWINGWIPGRPAQDEGYSYPNGNFHWDPCDIVKDGAPGGNTLYHCDIGSPGNGSSYWCLTHVANVIVETTELFPDEMIGHRNWYAQIYGYDSFGRAVTMYCIRGDAEGDGSTITTKPKYQPAADPRPLALPAPYIFPEPWRDPLIPPGSDTLPTAPAVSVVPDRALPAAVPGAEASSAGNAAPPSGGATVPAAPEPDRPVSPLPSRPPVRTTEKKRTNPLIPVLFKVWDAATEAVDAVDAVFGALPKPVRDDYHGRGLVDKAGYVFDHIDDVNIPKAIGNLIRNEAEDRAVGMMLGIADKAGVGMGLSGVGHLKR